MALRYSKDKKPYAPILFFLFHRAIDIQVNPTWPLESFIVKIMLKHTWFQPHNQYTSQGMFETVLPLYFKSDTCCSANFGI